LLSVVGPQLFRQAACGLTEAAPRSLNIMNFIRAEEPKREPMELDELPVREQMPLYHGAQFRPPWLFAVTNALGPSDRSLFSPRLNAALS